MAELVERPLKQDPAAGTVAVEVASAEELVAGTAAVDAVEAVVAAAEDDTVAVGVVAVVAVAFVVAVVVVVVVADVAPVVAEEQHGTAVELLGFVALALVELLGIAVGAAAAAAALAVAFVPSFSSSSQYSQRVAGDAASKSMYRCTLEKTWRNDTGTLPISSPFEATFSAILVVHSVSAAVKAEQS